MTKIVKKNSEWYCEDCKTQNYCYCLGSDGDPICDCGRLGYECICNKLDEEQNEYEITYKIPIYVHLENVLPSVSDLVDYVNNTMKTFGFNEKLSIRSRVIDVVITLPKKPTFEQIKIIRKKIEHCWVNNNIDQWQIEVANFSEWELTNVF